MPRERTVLRNPLFWVLLAGIVVVGGLRAWRAGPGAMRGPAVTTFEIFDGDGAAREPQQVPAFSLVNQEGEAFGSRQLEGSMYVGNFFFTQCPSICPLMMEAMASLQQRYHAAGIEGVRFVSFSVDPKRDTPERLLEYASVRNFDLSDWTLLTGPPETVRELLVDGFQVPLGEPEMVGGLLDIAHSGKFVLVNGHGVVDGYYGFGPEFREALFERTRELQALDTP